MSWVVVYIPVCIYSSKRVVFVNFSLFRKKLKTPQWGLRLQCRTNVFLMAKINSVSFFILFLTSYTPFLKSVVYLYLCFVKVRFKDNYRDRKCWCLLIEQNVIVEVLEGLIQLWIMNQEYRSSVITVLDQLIISLFCVFFSPLQMFVTDKVEDSGCSLHEFSITGSTYAPEGQM